MDELHDWSSYLIEVESTLKQINHKLLHGNYEGVEACVYKINEYLAKTLRWVAENREQ